MDANRINELPSYRQLVNRRRKMIWSISAALVLILFGNLYLMSGGTQLGSATLREGGVITIAVVYSIFVIFAGSFLATYYVWWANNCLDPLVAEVVNDIEKGL